MRRRLLIANDFMPWPISIFGLQSANNGTIRIFYADEYPIIYENTRRSLSIIDFYYKHYQNEELSITLRPGQFSLENELNSSAYISIRYIAFDQGAFTDCNDLNQDVAALIIRGQDESENEWHGWIFCQNCVVKINNTIYTFTKGSIFVYNRSYLGDITPR